MTRKSARRPIPLGRRHVDIPILAFFWVNIIFITYGVDIEQLIIDDPAAFEYPWWPPPFMVDLVHWWGRNFDPVLMARPTWWKMTIWIDAVYFGPFYGFAIYTFTRGRDWIRFPAFFYCGLMFANVTIILGEEVAGAHATPTLGIVLLANAPWLLFPLFILYRLWRDDPHPFTEPVASERAGP